MKTKNQQILGLLKKILVNFVKICNVRIQLFLVKGTFAIPKH